MSGLRAVSLKALRGERLDAADVHALRLASAALWTSGNDPSTIYLVPRLGLVLPQPVVGGKLPLEIPLIETSPLWSVAHAALLRTSVWHRTRLRARDGREHHSLLGQSADSASRLFSGPALSQA